MPNDQGKHTELDELVVLLAKDGHRGGASCPLGQPGEAHVRFGGVGPLGDRLGGGVVGDGPVQLVLHGGEEGRRGLGKGIVVDAGGVDFEDLAPEFLFR